jgi:hypothetical protein
MTHPARTPLRAPVLLDGLRPREATLTRAHRQFLGELATESRQSELPYTSFGLLFQKATTLACQAQKVRYDRFLRQAPFAYFEGLCPEEHARLLRVVDLLKEHVRELRGRGPVDGDPN